LIRTVGPFDRRPAERRCLVNTRHPDHKAGSAAGLCAGIPRKRRRVDRRL